MVLAEVFLGAFLQVLFDKLATAGLLELAGWDDITSLLKKSGKSLSRLRVVLADAEQKQIRDVAVRDWLYDLQALTYDLDDLVDDMFYEATRRKFMAESQASSSSSSGSTVLTSFIRSTSSIPSSIKYNHDIKSKLGEITERLKVLIEEKNDLRLLDNIPSLPNKLPTTCLGDSESSVRGRDNDKAAVLRLVLYDKETHGGNVGIIPIVGMPGVGKTTIAQLVYNEKEVTKHFNLKAWVCVSEEFDVFMITKIIFQSVTGESTHFEDLNILQVALKERISDKKFLIVLDDVWNENHDKWELLQRPFQFGMPGSKMIVTTRNDGVASTMHCGLPYRLKVLTEKESISLLALYSLGAQSFEGYSSFKNIGEDIARKCGGLPLALKTLGRLLQTKESVEEWDELLKSEIWNLSEVESGILPALRLSYYHLPPYLKQLFAYCSLFPKNYPFDKDELVLLWMGEGFLHDSCQRMEDLGLKYFKELLSRSFFQRSGDDESRYVMHDLMNDLAQFVAGEFFYRLEDDKHIGRKQSFGGRCHHASFIRRRYEVFSNFKDFHIAKGLRTFLPLSVQKSEKRTSFYISKMVLVDLLPRLQCLRVLSLSAYSIKDLPDCIRGMKHLRYLDLSQTEIECLPEWVGDLYNLQTLLLFGCRELAKLPNTFEHLTNLRHFDIDDTPKLEETPLGIGTLTTLLTLSKLSLEKNKGSRLRELKDLSDLRGTISIMGLHHVTSIHDAKAANLTSKQGLDGLDLSWSDTFDGSRDEAREKEVFDALKPHTNLRKLKIRSYSGVQCPNWVGDHSFSHVGEITLAGCRKCTSLPSLGQLPLLKKLCIQDVEGVEIVGSEFYGFSSGGQPVAYPLLEILEFEQMKNWEEWSTGIIDDGVIVFPCLRELRMLCCPKLVNVSLPQLLSLQQLEITGCCEVALGSILSFAASTTTLKLQDIAGLTQLHDELAREVVDLEIKGCKELKYLWRGRRSEAIKFQSHASVKRLCVDSCEQLVSLVEGEGEEEQEMALILEELALWDCENLVKLPSWLNCINTLNILNCPKLQSVVTATLTQDLVKRNGGGDGVMVKETSSNEILEGEEENFSQLKNLFIESCSTLTSLIPTGKNLPTTFKDLHLHDCNQLEDCNWLLVNNSKSSSLERICFSNWRNLKCFPEGFRFKNFFHLTSLNIEDCPGLESFPERGGLPPCLRNLHITGCLNLKWLPVGVNEQQLREWETLTSLQRLCICDCPRLESCFPCGVWPPNLKCLILGDLAKPLTTEWGLHNAPPSLVDLRLVGNFTELVSFSTSDINFLLPPSLTHLRLGLMEKLETLSTGLENLISLQFLLIANCPNLGSLPETLLPMLRELEIGGNCPHSEREVYGRKKRLLVPNIPHSQRQDR